uniref:Uncharacterized protein n=1 Tax=Pundamilia nyererei TaxID=303518 RepID=A0A3B4H677_9CICH
VNHQKRKLGMNVDAKITNSAPSSTSRQSPPGRSPPKNKKGKKCALSGVSAERGYQQPTVSSRTRALSPYTHRRMCQLSEDARQRLSHLQLGPHYFRKETESPTPFLFRNCPRSTRRHIYTGPMESVYAASLTRSWSRPHKNVNAEE